MAEMANTSTERIYTKIGVKLLPRGGEVQIDDEDSFYFEDVDGPIHVVSGLLKSDVVVMLRDLDASSGDVDHPDVTGFLVSHVETDGSGVLMSGDLVESAPRLWMNPHLRELWNFLYDKDYTFSDFGLDALDGHYESLLSSEAKLA